MFPLRVCVLWMVVCCAALTGAGAAQSTPAGSTQEVLVEMASRAGVIFAGQVLAVDRQDAAGYVDVRFQVATAVRGCAGRRVYVLREWAGLWAGQASRYQVGERLLMLLTARGPSGMSAPVDGQAGAIPLLAAAPPPVMDAQGQVVADTAQGVAERVADLRWVQARALRKMVVLPQKQVQGAWAGAPTTFFDAGALQLGTGLSVVLGWLHAAE